MKQALCTVGFAALCLTWAASVAAQPTPDHLNCYKMKDPVKLAAVVDLAPWFAVENGCKVMPAKMLCGPAATTITSAEETA